MKLFDDKICHVTFTHSDCADVWPAYFGEMETYFDSGMTHYVFCDKKDERLPDHVTPILYTDGQTYPVRMLECFDQIKDKHDFIFFDHEDMFLYDCPNTAELKKYYEIMKSGKVDHIRLIKGGTCKSKPEDSCPSLHIIENQKSKWIFSIQPSFWSIEAFAKLLKNHVDDHIWDLERKGQQSCKDLDLKMSFSYDGGRRRGLFHFDNSVYPYIATAIGKGKWNYSEYKTELGQVFNKYKIDPKKRGVNSFFHR